MHGLANADYHALPIIGNSGLKTLAKSPKHFAGRRDRSEQPERDSTRLGTLAHCMLLEPDQAPLRYVVKPEGHDGRTREGKAWMADNAGREVIASAREWKSSQRQADNVRALPEVGALLKVGNAEVSAFWVDEATGTRCKCRPDFVAPAGPGAILIDLKTCQDASAAGFAKTVWSYRYDLQASWYASGYARASGKPVLGFIFACVESEWPHVAAAYMLDDAALERGARDARRLLDLYADCVSSDTWPGYPESIQLLSLPAWAK